MLLKLTFLWVGLFCAGVPTHLLAQTTASAVRDCKCTFTPDQISCDCKPTTTPVVPAPAVWAPPLGVPLPSFGITQVGGPATHYVDNSSAAATDVANLTGSAAKPRKTFPTSLPAGAVLEVRGGPYTLTSNLSFISAGTVASPVFVRGEGDAPVVISGGLREVGLKGSYMIVEGLTFDAAAVRLVGHHLTLRDSDVKNFSPPSNSAAISGTGNDLVIFRVRAHHNGDATGTQEVDIHAVKFSSGSSSIWVLDSWFNQNGGDEIQLGDASSIEPWVHHVYFGRNVGYGSRENCVDIKRARDVIISQNDCSGYRASSSSAGEAVVVHNSPERVWLIGNKIHDSARGIVASSNTGASPIYVVGNMISGIKHTGTYDPNSLYAEGHAIQAWATPNLEIVSNTITDCDAGITYAGGDAATVRMNNNIMGKLNQLTHHVAIATSAAASKSTLSNCIAQGARIKWGTAVASGHLGCVSVDPLLLLDLSLATGSPAIDAGSVDVVYSTFFGLYGLSIAADSTGLRPQGKWDIGARERR